MKMLALAMMVGVAHGCNLPFCGVGCSHIYHESVDVRRTKLQCLGPDTVRTASFPVNTCSHLSNWSVTNICTFAETDPFGGFSVMCLGQGMCTVETTAIMKIPTCNCPNLCTPSCSKTEYCEAKAAGTAKLPTCKPLPDVNCEAHPKCAMGYMPAGECSDFDMKSGNCMAESLCGKTIFCWRGGNPCVAATCPVGTVCVPAPDTCTKSLCHKCENTTCPMPTCDAGDSVVLECPQDVGCYTRQRCGKSIVCVKASVPCCASAAVCPSDKVQGPPCTATELRTGTCVVSSQCCSRVYCRDKVQSGSVESLPKWAIVVMVSLGVVVFILSIAIVVMVSLGVVVFILSIAIFYLCCRSARKPIYSTGACHGAVPVMRSPTDGAFKPEIEKPIPMTVV
eukprot:TRINITY_DN75_c0_g2_i4.p1 TRINITY_DN75_c0_g2~~TRINITY_DN75_c0_g2_i4.p1  ORF type:complete len:394 (+),score=58.71 TRINITY_DN75_c0_g2_i4:40-1221(+)